MKLAECQLQVDDIHTTLLASARVETRMEMPMDSLLFKTNVSRLDPVWSVQEGPKIGCTIV
jgi:hypothetical protein